jgi:hypothetical protein
MGAEAVKFERRTPERGILFKVISDHLERYFETQAEEGIQYPGFIKQTFSAYLRCGILDYGFVRTYCHHCGASEIVSFSCKRRGFCPSCHGKRMNEASYHLCENVLPSIPMRQWVLSIPFELRSMISTDPKLISVVSNVFIRSVNRWLKQQARKMSVTDAVPGSITFIQRFGGGLQLNPHYHSLFLDGVYYRKNDQWLFHSIKEPSREDLKGILQRIISRIKALYEKGVFDRETGPHDTAGNKPSSQGYIQFMGDLVEVPKGEYREFEEAGGLKVEGFSIHAKVSTLSHQTDKLERLIRYVARGPIASERLSEKNGKIVYEMKRRWHNGADRVAFTPEGFIQRLIALIPPARSHLIRYHGVFAPNFKYRNKIIRNPTRNDSGETLPRSKKLLWAEMIAATFKIDVTECRECGGRMKPIAIIKDPRVAAKILTAMNISTVNLPSFGNRGPPDFENIAKIPIEDQRPEDW